MAELDAEAVENFLATPTAFGLPSDTLIERIDTHISVIFLAGPYAYKLKKRVDLAYLDFTTLEARRNACERELELNRRTAPTLYLEVVPVIQTAGGLTLTETAEGTVVDWVVKMVRFDQANLLSQMADRGALTVSIVETLARQLAGFHKGAEVSKADGGRTRFAEILESNKKNFAPFVGSIYPPKVVERLGGLYTDTLDAQSGLIEERRAANWVRHCHGDLHLNNVVYLDQVPVPFDCIEFNEQFARIDTLYDLAFLLMDLAFRAITDQRLAAHANATLNAYLQAQTPDDLSQTLKGLAALPLFMSIRASVRSHVTARMARNDNSDAVALGERALNYAKFAEGLLSETEGKLFAIGGLSGTGKTTIAKGLAPELGGTAGAVHLRSDIIRKRLAGVADTDRLPSEAYTQAASDQVYAEMVRLAGIALDAGQTVICDAVFSKPVERVLMEELAESRSVSFAGIWLSAPAKVLEARVDRRAEAGTDASDADTRIVRQQLSYDLGDLNWPVVEADGEPEAVLSSIRGTLDLTLPPS
ncbi:MAG: AAA family ATPase [Rhodobiaceae bacterium]|nr:AAA family ATPase [Rhodobiaceae bacterium]